MSYRSTRDWRGIKHHLGQYSVADLQALLRNAEAARDQLTEFVARVTAELAARDAAAGGRPADDSKKYVHIAY